jgi:hypothetical protein
MRIYKGASAAVLAAPGADCTNMVGKDGINDDRSMTPLDVREATLKGVLSFSFVRFLSSTSLMEDRSVLARTRERCTRRRASSRRKEGQALMNLDSVVLRNPLQWLDQCRHCQAASGNYLAGEGSGSACHGILVQCGRSKGRNKIRLWTKEEAKETRILTHLKTFEL